MGLYQISHQKCTWHIDLKRPVIKGIAQMNVSITDKSIRKIYLNARQIKIDNIQINKQNVPYQYNDPFDPLFPTTTIQRTVHHHTGIRQQYLEALQDGSSGELVIDIPESLQLQLDSNAEKFNDMDLDHQKNTDEPSALPKDDQFDQVEWVIKIEYRLEIPTQGVYFSIPNLTSHGLSLPCMYACGISNLGRLWMPCLDNSRQRMTWEINVITPSTVRHGLASTFRREMSDEDLDQEIIAVCIGELKEQILLPDGKSKLFKYTMNTPVHASSVMLAVGPFEVSRIPGWEAKIGGSSPQLDDEDQAAVANASQTADNQVPDNDYWSEEEDDVNDDEINPSGGGYVFTLPGGIPDGLHTMGPLTAILEKMEEFTGVSFPFFSMKLVFIDNLYCPMVSGSSIAFLSADLLVPKNVIDQIYESRRLIYKTVASQWMGVFLSPKSSHDTWVTTGLCNYLVYLGMVEAFGKNEVQYRLRKDVLRLSDLDVNQPPLNAGPLPGTKKEKPADLLEENVSGIESLKKDVSNLDPFLVEQWTPSDNWASQRAEWLELKSFLVFHMLNKRMSKGNLQKTVNKIMMSSLSGDMQNGISTNHFFKTSRKVSGKSDLNMFADQWVYGSGMPHFYINYAFNRRKMLVEVRCNQFVRNNCQERVTKLFTGPLVIRVHEPTGTFDTEVMIEDAEKVYEIPYHTKYKTFKKRKPRRRKSLKIESPEMRDANDGEDGEAIEDDLSNLSIEWIRIDPDNDWMCLKSFQQADFMWAVQLEKDKDVIAQLEAVTALSRIPSDTTVATLVEIINEERYFHRIRSEAVFALTKCAIEKLDWVGMNKLLLLYQDNYCYPLNDSYIPRTNRFDSFQYYFIQKSFVTALSQIKKPDGISPVDIRRFLLDLLKYNENTGNTFEDNYFISNLIIAIGNSFMKTPPPPLSIAEKAGNMFGKPNEPPRMLLNDQIRLSDDPLVEEFNFYSEPGLNAQRALDGAMWGNDYLFDSSEDLDLFNQAAIEIERRRIMDMIVPSYHNTVTVSCLQVMMRWMMADMINTDLNLFLKHTRYGHFQDVRLVSFDALLMLDGLFDSDVVPYLLDVIKDDPEPYVRYHISKSLFNYAILASTRNEDDAAARLYGKWDDIKKLLSSWKPIKDKLWDLINRPMEKRIHLNLFHFCELIFDSELEPIDMRLKIRVTHKSHITYEDDSSEDEFAIVIPLKKARKASEVKYSNIMAPTTITLIAPPPPPSLTLTNGTTAAGLNFPATIIAASSDPNSFLSKHRAKHIPNIYSEEVTSKIVQKAIKFMLDKLQSHPSSAFFIHPVEESFAPRYFSLISNPMWMSKIESKNNDNEYGQNFDHFLSDFYQIFENCFIYNEDTSIVSEQAIQLREYFENELVSLASEFVQDQVKKSEEYGTRQEKKSQTSIPVLKFSLGGNVISTTSHVSQYGFISSTPPPSLPLKLSPEDMRRCTNALKRVSSHAVSFWFTLPVDPVPLEIPDYFDVIKKPMDLSTVKKKLEAGDYTRPEDFEADMDLIFENAIVFNPHDSQVHKDSQVLREYFKQIWNNESTSKRRKSSAIHKTYEDSAMGVDESAAQNAEKTSASSAMELNPLYPTSTYSQNINKQSSASAEPFEVSLTVSDAQPKRESSATPAPHLHAPKEESSEENLKKCFKVFRKLQSHKAASIFLEPVDPVALCIPNYFEIVKRPMDLDTIGIKLNDYRDDDIVHEFRKDVELMLDNCFKFNAKGTWAFAQGEVLKGYFDHTWGDVFGDSSEIYNTNIPVSSHVDYSNTTDNLEKEIISEMIQKLKIHPDAAIFLMTVDKELYPDYYEKIEYPIDLSAMQDKLESGRYESVDDFEKDFNQMITNCFTYNAKRTVGYVAGQSLDRFFKKEWKSLTKQLNTKSNKTSTQSSIASLANRTSHAVSTASSSTNLILRLSPPPPTDTQSSSKRAANSRSRKASIPGSNSVTDTKTESKDKKGRKEDESKPSTGFKLKLKF